MIRYWFLWHRYLGIGCGLIMLLWTLSGVVMMYKPYPRLSQAEALQLQSRLVLDDCCQLSIDDSLAADTMLQQLRVDMWSGEPLLRFTTADNQLHSYNLASGEKLTTVSAQQASDLIATLTEQDLLTPRRKVGAQSSPPVLIERDQWTVYGAYNPHRPLYRIALNDDEKTEVYISSRSGELVQLTTADSRLWGYLGAVVHWIYPTALRQYTTTWYYLIIVLSLLGVFLTFTGLFVGLRQLKRRRSGRLSPYRGWAFWHHITGLVFGLVTLTWVASGLLSMNPLGLLEGSDARVEQKRLEGTSIHWRDLPILLKRLEQLQLVDDVVRLNWQVSSGGTALLVQHRDGVRERLSAPSLKLAPLSEVDLRKLALQMLTPQSVETLSSEALSTEPLSMVLLEREDDYYYSHHQEVELPVYRVISADKTHYYLSPVDGQLISKVDGERQLYRWLFKGVHRGDFTAELRRRPLWDGFMLMLLVGVSLLCGSGTYIGIKRLNFNVGRSRRRTLRPDLGSPYKTGLTR